MEPNRRPKNLLLIFCDQLRYAALGCNGNTVCRTPWMDSLAADGVCFDKAYTQTPVCMPARYGLLDGKNPCRLGIWDNALCDVPVTTALPAVIKKQGHFTCSVGKMHYNPPREHYGFDRRYLSEEITAHFDDDDFLQFLAAHGYGGIAEPQGRRSEHYYEPQVSVLPPQMHTTGWTGTVSCEFIRKNADRPWFLVSSFIKPHPPFDPSAIYLAPYLGKEMDKPVGGTPLNASDLSIHDQNDYKVNGAENLTPEYIEELRRHYYASVTQIDDQVGAIISQLKVLGLYDDTLIILTSDHGEMLGDNNAVGKRTYYDSSCHIPMIVSCPSLFRGGWRSDEPVTLEDVYATLVDGSGAKIPESSEGISLLPLCRGETQHTRDMIFCGFGFAEQRKLAVIAKERKYIYTVNGGREYLLDAAEQENLAEKEPETVQTLRRALCDWAKKWELDIFDGDALRQTPYFPARPRRGYLNQYPHWPATVPHAPVEKT